MIDAIAAKGEEAQRRMAATVMIVTDKITGVELAIINRHLALKSAQDVS